MNMNRRNLVLEEFSFVQALLDLVRSKMRERTAEHNHELGWRLVIPHDIYEELERAGDDMSCYFPHGYISWKKEKKFSLLTRIRQLIDKSKKK